MSSIWPGMPRARGARRAGRGLMGLAVMAPVAALVVAALAVALAASARAQPLIVAMKPQATAAPLAIAVERGWFVEAGLDVQLVPFHANQTMTMALAEGDVDIALVDMTAEAFVMASARNLRVIAAAELLQGTHPRHAWVVAADRAGAGLEGLGPDDAFGVTEVGSLARFLLARRAPAVAEAVQYRVEASDVALAAALAQGRVQAALLPAHLAADLEATGAGTVIGWAGEAEGPVLVSALLTSAAQATLRPELLQRFLAAYVRGLRAYRDAVLVTLDEDDVFLAAERDALLQVVAETARRPATELLEAPPYFSIDGRIPERSFAAQLGWWQQAGACPADIVAEALIDARPLDAALAALAVEAEAQAARDAAAAARAAAEAAEAAEAEADEETAAVAPTDPAAAGGP